MARPAPAAERAVHIVELLTSHSAESLTLTEIARRLSMNAASAHAVLAVLEDVGFVVRHPVRKTYGLGPVLVAVANLGAPRYPAIDAARDEIRRLSRQLDVELLLTAVAGRRIVALARAGRRHPLGMEVGQSVPYAPPLGSVFAAWEEPDEIAAWLERAQPSAGAAQRHRYEASAEAVQRRGYFVALDEHTLDTLEASLGEETGSPERPRRRAEADALVAELRQLAYHRQAPHTENMIAAPVFDADGRVVLAIVLLGLPEELTGTLLMESVERTRDTARVLTRQARGQVPGD